MCFGDLKGKSLNIGGLKHRKYRIGSIIFEVGCWGTGSRGKHNIQTTSPNNTACDLKVRCDCMSCL